MAASRPGWSAAQVPLLKRTCTCLFKHSSSKPVVFLQFMKCTQRYRSTPHFHQHQECAFLLPFALLLVSKGQHIGANHTFTPVELVLDYHCGVCKGYCCDLAIALPPLQQITHIISTIIKCSVMLLLPSSDWDGTFGRGRSSNSAKQQ